MRIADRVVDALRVTACRCKHQQSLASTVFATDDPTVLASLVDPQTETAEADLEMA